MQVHVDSAVMFLDLVDEPGNVHNGRLDREFDVYTPERWG
jgi:hypothetical protein